MIRALVLVTLLVPIGAVLGVAYARAERRQRREVDRREIVLDQEIQQNARDNYRLLEHDTRLIQRVLDADATMPMLSNELRDELQRAVSQFHENRLPKGNE